MTRKLQAYQMCQDCNKPFKLHHTIIHILESDISLKIHCPRCRSINIAQISFNQYLSYINNHGN